MKSRTAKKHSHESTSEEPPEQTSIDDEDARRRPTIPANSTKSIRTTTAWDAFIADDDERDPQPDYGDFWPED